MDISIVYLFKCNAARFDALHANNTEIMSMQMKRMICIIFIAFIDENDFDGSIQWYLQYVSALAKVRLTIDVTCGQR